MPNTEAPAAAAIHADIQHHGGWISFARYLEIALHDPQCGFYGSGRVQFGQRGDFITAPILSDLFGEMLAKQCAEIITQHFNDNTQNPPYILELGAGDGTLASSIIRALLNIPLQQKINYTILETSHALRTRQQNNLTTWTQSQQVNINWCETLPDNFCGIVIANEVLDAIPFNLCVRRNAQWQERGVSINQNNFIWQEREADATLLSRLQTLTVPDDYETEINLRAEALVRTICETMQRGAAIFIDYGFARAEYYHPQRTRGTLMCHCRGLVDDAPLESSGDKDITAHVDFSGIADAAIDGGAQLAGYVSQAQFLINCGITDSLSAANKKMDNVAYAKLVSGTQKLLNPHDLGELFKCIAFVKDIPPTLLGFCAGDKSYQL